MGIDYQLVMTAKWIFDMVFRGAFLSVFSGFNKKWVLIIN